MQISIWKKANLVLLFFLLRKLILPFYSFTLLCVILPLTMFIPEAQLPAWLICYAPICMSFLNVLPSSRSFPFTIPYLLFENTMSVTKFNAMLTGLLQMGSSYDWVVTKKAGRSSEANLLPAAATNSKDLNHAKLQQRASESTLLELHNLKKHDGEAKKPTQVNKAKRTCKKELAFALLFLTAAGRSFLSGWGVHFCVLLFQGASFLLVELGLIGQ